MTMINPPPHNISDQNRCGGGGGYGGVVMGRRLEGAGGYHECCTVGSDLFIGPTMAEDESRTESATNEEGTTSSSNKGTEEMRDHQGWLQLGIGGSSLDRAQPARPGSGLVELDLLPGGGGGGGGLEQVMMMTSSSSSAAATGVGFHVPPPISNVSSSFLLQYPGGNSGSGFPHHQRINTNWGHRPQNLPQSMMMPFLATASTSTFLMPGGSYLGRPFQSHDSSGGVDVGGGGVGSSSGYSVIDPPRRPHSGLWFVLQVSQNQSKEPFLPQIPKSYLRIKDGRMTVRLLMKYLVNKLKLDSESEIEIRCRGQQLLPFLTLQYVRDHIWRSPTDASAVSLFSDASTSDHVMVLNYARSP